MDDGIIPTAALDDAYAAVFELATAIVSATEAGDVVPAGAIDEPVLVVLADLFDNHDGDHVAYALAVAAGKALADAVTALSAHTGTDRLQILALWARERLRQA